MHSIADEMLIDCVSRQSHMPGHWQRRSMARAVVGGAMLLTGLVAGITSCGPRPALASMRGKDVVATSMNSGQPDCVDGSLLISIEIKPWYHPPGKGPICPGTLAIDRDLPACRHRFAHELPTLPPRFGTRLLGWFCHGSPDVEGVPPVTRESTDPLLLANANAC